MSQLSFICTLSFVILAACTAPPVSDQYKLAEIFPDYVGNDVPGAAVLVIQDGQKELKGTFGMANLDAREPVGSNTNFRLGSVTKQFTAMCILMLVDRDSLRLDDTLGGIFPDFHESADRITVTHLLQHTSGLLDYEDFVPAYSPTQVSDRDVLDILIATDSTYFEPGSAFRYSNSGYAVLALIVEKYSGQTFAEFLKQNIFDPLGMDGTVAYQKGISEVSNRAYGYSVTESGIENADQSPWSAVLGDGGIYSSLDDLYKWDQALYTDTLVSANLLTRAFTPHLDDYGFGWRIDTYNGLKRYHHSGSTSGFRNFVMRFPDEQLTVIVLTNRAEPDVQPLAERVAELVIGH
ncbi:MAG TPA: serine hydrolase domain-containing protein [Rhodothermia bacterium]|nr:serine hydrolase domain-containing protein [Rhodothermia bacterium]